MGEGGVRGRVGGGKLVWAGGRWEHLNDMRLAFCQV